MTETDGAATLAAFARQAATVATELNWLNQLWNNAQRDAPPTCRRPR